jgi:hypothetical protein
MSADLAWTAVEWPGMEHVVVSGDASGFRADGQVVLAADGFASVSYELRCTTGWRVSSLAIKVTNAVTDAVLDLSTVGDGHWLANGHPAPELDGCVDVDISCTPLTNTLPIRRLSWSTGETHDIDVVYVVVPVLDVHRARQRYTLLARDDDRDEALFRYQSGSFSADLPVDSDGFVTDYPGLWRRVEPASTRPY